MNNQVERSSTLGFVYTSELKKLIEELINFDSIQKDLKYGFLHDILISIRGQFTNDKTPKAIFSDCKPFIMASIQKLLPDNEPEICLFYKTIKDKGIFIHRDENDEKVYKRQDLDMTKLGSYCRNITRKMKIK